MIVKSFIADTVAGALKKARTELGGDAVILKTRRLDGVHPAAVGGKVEVTACVDRTTPAQNPLTAVLEPIAQQPARPAETNRLFAATTTPAKPVVADSPAAAPKSEGLPNTDRFPADEIVQKLDFLIDVVQAPLRRNAFPGNIGRLFASLLQADLPEAVAYDITEKITDRFQPGDSYRKIAQAAVEMICRQLPSPAQVRPFEAGQKVVVLGPAGSGKTSLIGRLARLKS
jgi:flagellar biosynthesis GTPase FlhF